MTIHELDVERAFMITVIIGAINGLTGIPRIRYSDIVLLTRRFVDQPQLF